MKHKRLELFTESVLVVLVSVVTLLLQLISFATTWNGAGIYLEGVFPYASLLFAVAIQATAYFFSNSLRSKVTVLKVIAMLVAMCCSTYYSYIGIYNSVNSPVTFLQENYARIEKELTDIHRERVESEIAVIKDMVNDAGAKVIAEYSLLSKQGERIEACREELSVDSESYAENMRAPKQWEYETYEEYAAAYRVYVESISTGGNTEEDAKRQGILSAYGFNSVEEINLAEAEQQSTMTALLSTLNVPEGKNMIQTISDTSVRLDIALDELQEGNDLSVEEYVELSSLLRGAALCEMEEESVAEIIGTVKEIAEISGRELMADYGELVAMLEGGKLKSSNTMELKALMDSQILNALLQLDMQEDAGTEYAITDLYLVPIRALKEADTRMTALFCLGMAALVDGLSLLFAISLKGRKNLWNRHSLIWAKWEDYVPQIQAALPEGRDFVEELAIFLERFLPSPETESEGYMMCTSMTDIEEYGRLTALLCQVNLAKIMPDGFLGKEGQTLLLKARFVFWVHSVIYEMREQKEERILYE